MEASYDNKLNSFILNECGFSSTDCRKCGVSSIENGCMLIQVRKSSHDGYSSGHSQSEQTW